MTYIEELKDVIRKLHGVESTHRESVPVKEVFNGKTVWDGIVENCTVTQRRISPMLGATQPTIQRIPNGT